MDGPPEPETVDTPSEGPPGPVTAPEEGTPNTDVTPPEPPKRKGRPPGSKDTVKRTRRPPVQVRIEPLEAVASAPKSASKPPTLPPSAEPEPSRPELVVEVTPPSPRTQIREHTRHLIRLKADEHENKKAAHAQMYVSRWPQLPVV